MATDHALTKVLSKKQISSRIKEAKDSLYHYRYRIDSLWKRSPVLQEKYPGSDDAKFEKYIDTEAILYFRELQECGVSFPTWQDMITVGGETDLRLFLQIGRSCYEDIVKYLPERNSLRMLDFGVGCGRTARHFYLDLERYELHGCDVDATPIEYLYRSVPFIQPIQSSNNPPLPYDSGYFDVIYSVSVFSHLKQTAFYDWAEELLRIMRPGGILVITIHGSHALDITLNKRDATSMGIDRDELQSAESLFQRDGFIWVPQVTTSPDIDTSQYGISYVDEKRLSAFIPSDFRIKHYGVGEIGDWQDLVVLEKV